MLILNQGIFNTLLSSGKCSFLSSRFSCFGCNAGATSVIRDGNSAQNRRNMLVFIHNIGAMHPIHAVDILAC